MFLIETWCGRKWGGWAKGRIRFPTQTQAETEIAGYRADERKADASVMKRRVAGA